MLLPVPEKQYFPLEMGKLEFVCFRDIMCVFHTLCFEEEFLLHVCVQEEFPRRLAGSGVPALPENYTQVANKSTFPKLSQFNHHL